jgi:hypothetical protein
MASATTVSVLARPSSSLPAPVNRVVTVASPPFASRARPVAIRARLACQAIDDGFAETGRLARGERRSLDREGAIGQPKLGTSRYTSEAGGRKDSLRDDDNKSACRVIRFVPSIGHVLARHPRFVPGFQGGSNRVKSPASFFCRLSA